MKEKLIAILMETIIVLLMAGAMYLVVSLLGCLVGLIILYPILNWLVLPLFDCEGLNLATCIVISNVLMYNFIFCKHHIDSLVQSIYIECEEEIKKKEITCERILYDKIVAYIGIIMYSSFNVYYICNVGLRDSWLTNTTRVNSLIVILLAILIYAIINVLVYIVFGLLVIKNRRKIKKLLKQVSG